jgi:glycosyltransferase involved in cell wall biosynthesis
MRPNIRVKQFRFCQSGWRQKLHYASFGLWALAWTLVWRPDWVYASDLFSCPISLLLSWIVGTPVVYHEHDEPAPVPSSLFIRIILRSRRRLARRAMFCVVPNEGRARRFAEGTGAADIICVWNCPSRHEVLPKARPPKEAGEISILYHGSLGPGRLPKTVLEALARLPRQVRLRVIGYETVGCPGYRQELERMASVLGIAGRVEFLGTLSTRAEVLDWCRKSDIGLALMPMCSQSHNEQNMAGASNKAFDCLASGMTLLVSDLPAWRSMFVDPGYGLACNPDSASSIADALEWFVDHPKEMRAMGDAGRRRTLEQWNYDVLFAPVRQRLMRAPDQRERSAA